MARLTMMPPLLLDQTQLAPFGAQWTANGQSLSRTPPYSSGQLGAFFDAAVGRALATMLGGIPISTPNANSCHSTASNAWFAPHRLRGSRPSANYWWCAPAELRCGLSP